MTNASKSPRTKVLAALILACISIAQFNQPAFAEGLSSSSNGLTVSASEKSAKIDYSLPSNVTLGSSDVVTWAVTDISTEDLNGNKSVDLLKGALNDYNDSGPLKYQLSPLGRKATLDFTSVFAGRYSVTVTAKVGSNSYSNTQSVNLSVSSTRNAMTYSDGQAPSLIYESPDVGKDLQTVVRFKINWKRPTMTGVPDGPYWVYMWTVDSKGVLVRQPWEASNPGVKVFWNDPQLNQNLPTGTDWINLPVKYSDWVASGGVHVRVWWSVADVLRGRYIWFEKIFDIPINFPKPTASLESNCEETFVDKSSTCQISLKYKDALGNSANGIAQAINWQISDGNSVLKSETSQFIQSGGNLEIYVPASDKSLTLKATIVGTNTTSQATAKAHDYNLDLLNSIKVSKNCPNSFKGNSFKCSFGVEADSNKTLKFTLYIQQKVDSAPWKTIKKLSISANTSTSLSLPSNEKKSLSVRAFVTFSGETIYSEVQDWIVSTPASNSNSNSDVRIAAIRSGLKEGCSRIPSRLNIKYVGPGPSSGGNPGRTYSVNGIFNVVIYDLGDSWNFGAYPLFGQNQDTAALWNCGSGGKGAVLRMYFVNK